jgi:hypothetical protein
MRAVSIVMCCFYSSVIIYLNSDELNTYITYVICVYYCECRNPGELNPLLENSNVLQGDDDTVISLTSHRFMYLSSVSH